MFDSSFALKMTFAMRARLESESQILLAAGRDSLEENACYPTHEILRGCQPRSNSFAEHKFQQANTPQT